MKTTCAWCGIHLHGDPRETTISHGICATCFERVNTTAGVPPALIVKGLKELQASLVKVTSEQVAVIDELIAKLEKVQP